MNVIAAWRWLPETRTAEQRAASPPQRKPLWHAASEVLDWIEHMKPLLTKAAGRTNEAAPVETEFVIQGVMR